VSRALCVALNLLTQGIERFEAALVADVFDKIDLDMPTVHLALEIEQMHLEQQAVVALQGRAIADVGHAGKGVLCQPQHLHREHPAQRRRAPQQADVQCRKADRTAALVAMRDPSADAVTAPKAACGVRQVTGLQGIAYPRAADAAAVFGHGIQALDTETELPSDGGQKRKIANPVATEAEIVTDVQMPDTEFLYQDTAHEIVGIDCGKGRVEADQEHTVDAAGIDRLELLAQSGQTRRRLLGAEEFHRLRLEGDYQRRQTGRARTRRQCGKDRLMPKVHTIEVADGRNAIAVGRA